MLHTAIPGRRIGPAATRSLRRWLILLVLACALAPATAVAQDGSLDQQVFEVARQLRCPVCVSESVADSNARVSIEMRELIQQQLAEGRSEAEILAFFQRRYGDWILLEPPRRGIHLVVWLLPVIAGVVAVAGLALYVRRWLAAGRETPDVDDEDLARVRRELAGEGSGPSAATGEHRS